MEDAAGTVLSVQGPLTIKRAFGTVRNEVATPSGRALLDELEALTLEYDRAVRKTIRAFDEMKRQREERDVRD